LENENIVQNDANHNLDSKEGIHKCGIWPELVEFCEKKLYCNIWMFKHGWSQSYCWTNMM
jgi:hypothetical protein